MKPFPPSVAEQALYLIDAMSIPRDAPTANEYGRLMANLAMMKINAKSDPAAWEAFVQHVLFPDHVAVPEGLFIAPVESIRHYKLLLDVMDELFNAYAPEDV